MIPDQGFDLYVEQVSSLCRNLLLEEFIEANRHAILRYVVISRKFLDSLGEPDHVLVSFSDWLIFLKRGNMLDTLPRN